ncbi:hypothetical protein HHK36_025410 [Tetracentron sinense]|uniref:DUF7781 domain-containing protein n=1 Tax=Tetracentron sinense TaxID=13715 RepID=A0A834YII9_TETSI|nr:hypothetical protein HHK36_025410 [Tetracentron sinense]
MESGTNGEEPTSWDELYNINLVPTELFLKFRKEIQGFRVGLNLEFYNAPSNEYQAKLVLKPLNPDRRWKFMYEPIHHDVRLLSKKIPITRFLNLQVGVGHSFQLNATGWKWKLSTCLGGDGVSRIRNKTSLGLFPGMDLRFGWRAEYVLPEITGSWMKPYIQQDCGHWRTNIQPELRTVASIIRQSGGNFNSYYMIKKTYQRTRSSRCDHMESIKGDAHKMKGYIKQSLL